MKNKKVVEQKGKDKFYEYSTNPHQNYATLVFENKSYSVQRVSAMSKNIISNKDVKFSSQERDYETFINLLKEKSILICGAMFRYTDHEQLFQRVFYKQPFSESQYFIPFEFQNPISQNEKLVVATPKDFSYLFDGDNSIEFDLLPRSAATMQFYIGAIMKMHQGNLSQFVYKKYVPVLFTLKNDSNTIKPFNLFTDNPSDSFLINGEKKPLTSILWDKKYSTRVAGGKVYTTDENQFSEVYYFNNRNPKDGRSFLSFDNPANNMNNVLDLVEEKFSFNAIDEVRDIIIDVIPKSKMQIILNFKLADN